MAAGIKRRVLVLAYSISPVRGSEYAVGWNYVKNMSREHELFVLYGLAGDHMGDLEEMKDVDGSTFVNPVMFVPIEPTFLAKCANYLNRIGWLPYSFYFAYRHWHREAFKVAKRLSATHEIDVVHYLCPIGFREPGYLWKLDKPYIWGPIGGIASRPTRPFFGLSWKTGAQTLVRNFVNRAQFRFSWRVRRALRRADVLLAATSENADAIQRVHGLPAIVIPENGIIDAPFSGGDNRSDAERIVGPGEPPSVLHDEVAGKPIHLIWVGSVETRKALTILLRALAELKDSVRWTLDVVGSGPLIGHAQEEAVSLGVDRYIAWHGRLSREEAVNRFQSADLHVVTSLAEGHPTTIWEAMSYGVPTIAFDLCGMRDSLAEGRGVKLPVGDLPEMIDNLAGALTQLATDRASLWRLRVATQGAATHFSWSSRVRFWGDMYEAAIRHRKKVR
ncbi:glycosyltransferase family 4 protein [Sphingomonas sp. IC-56]|uniref:glycosyltransferase family 4 protein n=1 Tax=Sphingomonas sp. IC-56 TaxID=2898529 RepID=UPI001E5CDDDA|nr:glycosyltransferase family 4 protein [Sphingomonas sp. IC-56]MCD2323312.1 glycosyltransferase family 4 protein [Sphingomonas sp. IC-56]